MNGKACFGVYFVKSDDDRLLIKFKQLKLIKNLQCLPRLFYFNPNIDLNSLTIKSITYKCSMDLVNYCEEELNLLNEFIKLGKETKIKKKKKIKKKRKKSMKNL